MRVRQLFAVATCMIALLMGAIVGSEVALWTCADSRDRFDCLGRGVAGAGAGLVLGAGVGIVLALVIVRSRRSGEQRA